MNDFLMKYLSGLFVGLSLVVVTTGFTLGVKVINLEEEQIELKKQVMNRELLEEKFRNMNDKLDQMEKRQEKKFDTIIEKLDK